MAFFDFYNQLSRLKNITASGSVEDLLYGGSMSGEEDSDDDVNGRGKQVTLPRVGVKGGKMAGVEVEEDLSEDNDDNASNATTLTHEEDVDDSILRDDVSTSTNPRRPIKGTSLVSPPDGFVGTYRPASARSLYSPVCGARYRPKPALMIRKGVTSELNLKSQNMGDKVAKKLAFSLEVMPYLQHLNISDNSLTDPGLTAIIKGLHHCKSLRSIDISRNKIDIEAAQALGSYLQSDHCHLDRLVLQVQTSMMRNALSL